MSTSKNKCIGITLGDPAGIGPEVTHKALQKTSIRRSARFKVIGEKEIFKKFGLKTSQNVELIDVENAKSPIDYLNKSFELLKNKAITGLVTAPVCKETIHTTLPSFQGHTEFLAEAFKVKHVDMMFVAERLKTVIITRHISLNKVSRAVTQDKVYRSIELTNRALKTHFKIVKPKIALTGLNPHAGEGGVLGSEEIETIIPAIKKAKANHIHAVGPFPADTLFSPAKASRFDVIIAMYHDQGLIPIKTLYFNQLVNLTIGLPFIRTSPAHGTAFDIAGQNKADPSSMCEAIKLAVQLA